MELLPLVFDLLKPMLWLLPLLFIAAYLNSPSFKGKMGERTVRRIVEKRLDPKIYREFFNVTIATDDGGTTQIDHIYVSPFGVFVVETKNFRGWIFGSRSQARWTQIIYKRRISFQNPLRQNYRHIKILESILGLPLTTFKSVVVFTGDCTFKTEMPSEICTCTDLIEYMRSIDTRILSDSQVSEICAQIISVRLDASSQVHRDHVRYLRRKHG